MIDKRAMAGAGLLAALLLTGTLAAQSFTDVTGTAGLTGAYGASAPGHDALLALMTAGIAVGDYDGDGDEDIFWAGGSTKVCRLYRNNGDGTFTDVAFAAGVAYLVPSSGPLFFDADGDADLDLLLTTYENQVDAGINPLSPWLEANYIGLGYANISANPEASRAGDIGMVYRNFFFENLGDGSFRERAGEVGLKHSGRFGSVAGDIDGDGHIDLVSATWTAGETRFFRNDGTGRFRQVTPGFIRTDPVRGFTPAIVDFDNDGDNDVLMANDLSSSRIYRNEGWPTFTDHTTAAGVGSDENGMGSAIGDFDNDGDLDWFVTSIYSPVPIEIPAYYDSGNRLYSNDGDGTFTDVTEAAGVRDGGWGWGVQFADIDNDGDLDVVQANGWTEPNAPQVLDQFLDDTLRIWVNQGDGSFTDQAVAFGLDDDSQGRGLVVFDYDNDGALDVLVANFTTGLHLWRNDAGAVAGHWMELALRASGTNRLALGARVTISATGLDDQVRVVRCANNYLSSPPIDLWVGLGAATSASVSVDWPDGGQSVHVLAADQRHVITQP